MSKFRVIKPSLWNDEKIEEFSPEDKYFWLFLLTNPNTTQLGIYQLTKKQATFWLGYSNETFDALIDRFENRYNLIKYSNETKEIAIKNYLNHNVSTGGKPLYDLLVKETKDVKDYSLLEFIINSYVKKEDNNTLNNFINYLEDYLYILNTNNKYKHNNKYNNDSLAYRGRIVDVSSNIVEEHE